jgi:hypothetical protein
VHSIGDAVDSSISFDLLCFEAMFLDDRKAECKVRIRALQGTPSNSLYPQICFASLLYDFVCKQMKDPSWCLTVSCLARKEGCRTVVRLRGRHLLNFSPLILHSDPIPTPFPKVKIASSSASVHLPVKSAPGSCNGLCRERVSRCCEGHTQALDTHPESGFPGSLERSPARVNGGRQILGTKEGFGWYCC